VAQRLRILAWPQPGFAAPGLAQPKLAAGATWTSRPGWATQSRFAALPHRAGLVRQHRQAQGTLRMPRHLTMPATATTL